MYNGRLVFAFFLLFYFLFHDRSIHPRQETQECLLLFRFGINQRQNERGGLSPM